jgi:hypothetical protein
MAQTGCRREEKLHELSVLPPEREVCKHFAARIVSLYKKLQQEQETIKRHKLAAPYNVQYCTHRMPLKVQYYG